VLKGVSEIRHNQLDQFIRDAGDGNLPGFYLIHGQQMLVEKASVQLMSRLLNGASADLCSEKIEGAVENLADALESLSTFALSAGPKIILFKEAKLFEGRRDLQRLVDQITATWKKNDVHQTAKFFVSLCRRLQIPLEEVLDGYPKSDALHHVRDQLGADGMDKILQYCHRQGWSVDVSSDPAAMLQQAFLHKLPPNHFFIVTVTSKVPKNLKLYKSFSKHGAVVDCNIPLGERRSDKAAQEAVLKQTMDAMLSKSNKRISPKNFQSLCRLTGFEPQIFVQNVQKLIDYVGQRTEITGGDIQSVLKRTRVDPVFELTNAAADRNLFRSLAHLESLLDAQWHPLQILSALVNQVRKLLVAKSFTVSAHGKSWDRTMAYSQFQKTVMPNIIAFDNQLKEQGAAWIVNTVDRSAKGKRKTHKAPEVVLAANPKSPYPVYQNMLKADKFTVEELVDILVGLNQTDRRLKSTGQDPAMVIKKTLMDICVEKQ
jgi:DNA polymerase-3 subunit delta